MNFDPSLNETAMKLRKHETGLFVSCCSFNPASQTHFGPDGINVVASVQ